MAYWIQALIGSPVAFIVTVHKNDLGPDLVLFPGLEMLNPSKPDNVFLEAAPCLRIRKTALMALRQPRLA
jgi:hypothetical protein